MGNFNLLTKMKTEILEGIERSNAKLLVEMMLNGTEFPHCVAHPGYSGCWYFVWAKTKKVIKGLLQLILPFLIFKLKTLRTEGPIKPLLKLLKNILRSVA